MPYKNLYCILCEKMTFIQFFKAMKKSYLFMKFFTYWKRFYVCKLIYRILICRKKIYQLKNMNKMYKNYRFYGVVVSTRDSESRDPGSSPGRTYNIFLLHSIYNTYLLLLFLHSFFSYYFIYNHQIKYTYFFLNN